MGRFDLGCDVGEGFLDLVNQDQAQIARRQT